MKTCKKNEMNAQKQKDQALNAAASAHKACDILMANPSLKQAFQAASEKQSLNAAAVIPPRLAGESTNQLSEQLQKRGRKFLQGDFAYVLMPPVLGRAHSLN
ncbi:unnamed protein product [Cuscuta campestris]|uniref:Uncharacterized protein n=1 Tax=Cuscuta campestris TaxID=132261 RepID=A0A484N3A0_9ASTE|nr:unnamed protein product [Cuscuta campestris]